MSLHKLSFLIIILYIHIVNGNFNCISITSEISQPTELATTSVGCTDLAHPLLVSCGFKSNSTTQSYIKGVYHDNTNVGGRCIATNGPNSAGVYAIARCCNLPIDITCRGYRDTNICKATGDDKRTTCACANFDNNNYPITTGCAIFADSNSYTRLDGVWVGSMLWSHTRISYGIDYPEDNTCRAAAGNTGTIYASLTCCKSPSFHFQCKRRYVDGIPIINHLNCSDPDYQVVGCTGYGVYATLNGWWINNNNECWARGMNTQKIWASIICCRVSETRMPTTEPTFSPTRSPTNDTISPTMDPTFSPSLSPTNNPTIPTIDPTLSPSDTPTNTPSFAPTHPPSVAPTYTPSSAPTYTPILAPSTTPTNPPTESPSQTPTLNPTMFPTFTPTDYPTMEPTFDPTSDPTEPTMEPSMFPTVTPTNNPTLAPTIAPNHSTLSPTMLKEDEGLEGKDGLSLEYIIIIICLSVLFFIILGICIGYKVKKGKESRNHFSQIHSTVNDADIDDETNIEMETQSKTLLSNDGDNTYEKSSVINTT